MKVGQICGLSKNGSWVVVDVYQFFWGSLIRARTGSFANVSTGTSPLYIKVGQIFRLSKNGSWDLVDACRFFSPNILLFDLFFPEKVLKKMCPEHLTPQI